MNSERAMCNNYSKKKRINSSEKKIQCEEVGCCKKPYFGFKEDRARFCSAHKLKGMQDIQRRRRCNSEGCHIQPCFSYEGFPPRFCSAHKLSGMVDVKNKRCEKAGCKKQPIYGMLGHRGKFCRVHKQPEMVNIQKRLCSIVGCKAIPTHNFPGQRSFLCGKHCKVGMVAVRIDRSDKTRATDENQIFTQNLTTQSVDDALQDGQLKKCASRRGQLPSINMLLQMQPPGQELHQKNMYQFKEIRKTKIRFIRIEVLPHDIKSDFKLPIPNNYQNGGNNFQNLFRKLQLYEVMI